jgi:hypothetical protein
MNKHKEKKNITPKYTVYRCKSKTDTQRKGALHYANNNQITLCGKQIDENWFINEIIRTKCSHCGHEGFNEKATCKICNQINNIEEE